MTPSHPDTYLPIQNLRVARVAPRDTAEQIDRLWIAAKTSTSVEPIDDLWTTASHVPIDKKIHLIAGRVLLSGHWSIGRHAAETFLIEGVSRACSHQLVRHSVGTAWTQRSQRYVSFSQSQGTITPATIAARSETDRVFQNAIQATEIWYQDLIAAGIPREDARFVLPNAAATALTLTINWQALHNLCAERLCILAQWEIRHVVSKIRAEMVRTYPWAAPFFTVKCMRDGTCREIRNRDGRCRVRPYDNPTEKALSKVLHTHTKGDTHG